MKKSPDGPQNALFDSFAGQLAAIDPDLSPRECWSKVKLVIDQLGIWGVNLFSSKFADECKIEKDGERIIITVKKYPKGTAKKLRVMHLVFREDSYIKLELSTDDPSGFRRQRVKTLKYVGFLSGLETPSEADLERDELYRARVAGEKRAVREDVEGVFEDDIE